MNREQDWTWEHGPDNGRDPDDERDLLMDYEERVRIGEVTE